MNGIDPAGFDPLAYPLDPAWFARPSSIHGITHVRRVLIHAQAIAAARDIDPDWFESLVLAAAWHDIGRTHDGREPEHGPNSVAKVRALGLGEGVHPLILARALFAIQWHSVPDHLGAGPRRLAGSAGTARSRAPWSACCGCSRTRTASTGCASPTWTPANSATRNPAVRRPKHGDCYEEMP